MAESRKQAFWTGWFFGFGHFVTSLYWIAISMLVEPDKFAWLIPFTVSLVPAFLSIYVGLVGIAYKYIEMSGWRRVLHFSCLWLFAEMVRATLFTGFPWNLIGYVWPNLEILQITSVIGIYGLGLFTVALALTPYVYILDRLARKNKKRKQPTSEYYFPGVVLLMLCLIWVWGNDRLNNNETKYTDQDIHLIQANIPQSSKWVAEERFKNFMTSVDLSKSALDNSSKNSYLIWSETSVPFILEESPDILRVLDDELPDDVVVMTGALRVERSKDDIKAWNSLYVIKGDGKIAGYYDKTRLVPFGEFIPLRSLLPSFVQKITYGSIDFSTGNGPETNKLDGISPFSPLICYEIIFPNDVVNSSTRPDWLLNITNDAWFGDSIGPHQHLAMARIRAIEYGLPLVRVANTGISALVDSEGRILAQTELNSIGKISSKLPEPIKPTVYSRYKIWIVLVITLLVSLVPYIANKKRFHP